MYRSIKTIKSFAETKTGDYSLKLQDPNHTADQTFFIQCLPGNARSVH